MSGGRKPDIAIKVKGAQPGSGGSVSLAAFWREDGRLRGGWDKRVKRVAVLVDDGQGGTTKLDIVKGADGKWSHYCNAWEEVADAPAPKPRSNDAPPDFGGDDDIPF